MNRLITSITATARLWSHEHLKLYIQQLTDQIDDMKLLLKELSQVEREKQKEINKKLESGPRG